MVCEGLNKKSIACYVEKEFFKKGEEKEQQRKKNQSIYTRTRWRRT